MSEEMAVQQWLAIRKEAALKIDPDPAEVISKYVEISDPYGLHPDRLRDGVLQGDILLALVAVAPGLRLTVCHRRSATCCENRSKVELVPEIIDQNLGGRGE